MERPQAPLHHLELPPHRLRLEKKPKGKFIPHGKLKQEDRAETGVKLRAGLSRAEEADKSYTNKSDMRFFKVSFREEIFYSVHKAKLEKLKMHWLNAVDKNSVIVGVEQRHTKEVERKIDDYSNRGALKSYLDDILKIEPINPADKIRPLRDTPGNEYVLDIDFYCNLDLEEYERSIRAIDEVGGKQGLIYRSTKPEMPYIRIRTSKQNVEKIASSTPIIRKIETVPPMAVTHPSKQKTPIQIQFSNPVEGAEKVMVIDCGVRKDHPGIRNVLICRKNYIDGTPEAEDIDSGDDEGHGTQVAGIASYGLFSPTSNIIPSSKIGVSKIHDGKSSKPIQDMLEDIVKEGVEKSFRIYSLTVMLSQEAFEISKLATKIDQLAREYNVLFVISTGNIGFDVLAEFQKIGLNYPAYFADNKARIYEGAEACCAITVGGVALSESADSIAGIRQASPFTRAGPTPDQRLKPDLVHFAGNLTRSFNSPDNLGIPTFNRKFEDSLLTTGFGTSFSAPMVANLASQILSIYKKASPNLIRALLVHSAEIHEHARSLSDPHFVYGHGFPDENFAKYSTLYSPTMYIEGEIVGNSIAQIEVPVPKELERTKGSRFMKITLAYDPPVDYGNAGLNYTVGELKFRVLRKNDSGLYKTVPNDMWKQPRFFEDADTIKKGMLHLVRNIHAGEDWKIEVYPKWKYDGKDKMKQRFALVITIMDAENNTDLYNPLRALLDAEKLKAEATVRTAAPQRAKAR